MPQTLTQLFALALVIGTTSGLGAGRLGARGPQPGKADRAAPTNPADEVPEVAAYFKKKGWSLARDTRISDFKPLTFLVVQDRAKPFDKIDLTADDYKMIARSKTVQALDLRWVKATDEGLKAVAGIPQLEAVIVAEELVTDAGIKALAGSKSLDNVTLIGTKKVTDAGVKELAALPNLKTLYLSMVTLTGSAFEAFAGSKTLESVTLEYVDGFTDAGAKNLAKLPNLNALKITTGFQGTALTTAGIKAIADAHLPAKFDFDKKLLDDDLLEALVAKGWLYGPSPPGAGAAPPWAEKKPATPEEVKVISLDNSRVTDRGLKSLLKCTNVTSLHLSRTGITDETLKQMTGFKKLNYVALDHTKATAAGVGAIAGLPIRHISLEGCELTEDSFRAFGKMATLEELWLADTKFNPAWIEHIAALPKLKDLNLRNAAFDDAAAKFVAKMPNIQNLTLNSTALGDAGFKVLVDLPKLRSLYVDGTKVTKEVYQKAKKEHPKLLLYFYSYDR
jgi:Leucine-rich repeat (LRR) protein